MAMLPKKGAKSMRPERRTVMARAALMMVKTGI
jgi:hypothetical protein